MCLLLSSFGILSIRERIWLNDYYMCLKLFRCYPIWSVSSSCHHIHRCIFNSRITRINEDSHIFFFFSFEFQLNPNRYLIKLRHSSCAPLWSHWTTNDKDNDLTRLHIIRHTSTQYGVNVLLCRKAKLGICGKNGQYPNGLSILDVFFSTHFHKSQEKCSSFIVPACLWLFYSYPRHLYTFQSYRHQNRARSIKCLLNGFYITQPICC